MRKKRHHASSQMLAWTALASCSDAMTWTHECTQVMFVLPPGPHVQVRFPVRHSRLHHASQIHASGMRCPAEVSARSKLTPSPNFCKHTGSCQRHEKSSEAVVVHCGEHQRNHGGRPSDAHARRKDVIDADDSLSQSLSYEGNDAGLSIRCTQPLLGPVSAHQDSSHKRQGYSEMNSRSNKRDGSDCEKQKKRPSSRVGEDPRRKDDESTAFTGQGNADKLPQGRLEDESKVVSPSLSKKGQIANTRTPRARAWVNDSEEVKRQKRHTEDLVFRYACEGRWREAVDVLVAYRRKGLGVTPRAYNTALRAVGRAGQVRKAITLIEEIREQGYVVTQYNYGAALHACAKQGDASTANLLLEEMRLHGVTPNEIIYNSAIKACEAGERWHEALGMLDRMDLDGLAPNRQHFNAALSVVGKAGKYGHVKGLLQKLDARGIERCTFTWAAAIDAAGRIGRVRDALRLLGEMLKAGRPKPNLFVFNAALAACARASHPSEAVAKASLRTIDEARMRGISPDARTYAGAMLAFARAGRVKEALMLLDVMEEKDSCRPTCYNYCNAIAACATWANEGTAENAQNDVLTKGECAQSVKEEEAAEREVEETRATRDGNSLLDDWDGWITDGDSMEREFSELVACTNGRLGEYDDPHATGDMLMRRMGEEKVKADPILCVSLMQLWSTAPGRNGWRRAIDLLQLMRSGSLTQEGLLLPPPCELTYEHAMSACTTCGQPEEARRLLEKMEEAGVKPGLRSYLAAMRAMRTAGPSRAAEVIQIFNDMRSVDIVPNKEACFVVAEAYASEGLWEEGLWLLSLMSRIQVLPTTYIYNEVIRACASKRRWYRCLSTLRGMGSTGQGDLPDETSYGLTIGALCKAGETKQAARLLPDMTEAGLRVGASEYDALLRSACAKCTAPGSGRRPEASTLAQKQEVVALITQTVIHLLSDARRAGALNAAASDSASRDPDAHGVDGVVHPAQQGQLQPAIGNAEANVFLPGMKDGLLEGPLFRACVRICLEINQPESTLIVTQGAKVAQLVRRRLYGDTGVAANDYDGDIIDEHASQDKDSQDVAIETTEAEPVQDVSHEEVEEVSSLAGEDCEGDTSEQRHAAR